MVIVAAVVSYKIEYRLYHMYTTRKNGIIDGAPIGRSRMIGSGGRALLNGKWPMAIAVDCGFCVDGRASELR